MFLVCVLSSCIKFMFWIRFRLMFCVRVPRSCSTFMFCIHVPCSNSYICRQKKIVLNFLYKLSDLKFRITIQAHIWGIALRLSLEAYRSGFQFIFWVYVPMSYPQLMVRGHDLRSWSKDMVWGHGPRSWFKIVVWSLSKFWEISGHDTDISISNINQQVRAVVAGPRTLLDVTHFVIEHLKTSRPTVWKRILSCFKKM